MSQAPSPSEAITIPKRVIQRALLGAAALLVAIAVVIGIVAAVRSLGAKDSLASAINSSEYQAVLLNNGQIYFGKLSAPGGDFYYLRHVYYLTESSTRTGKPLRSLAKLTNDVHGPEDFMAINRGQIVYMENLSPSGQASRLLAHSP